jgi:hypothetical protein
MTPLPAPPIRVCCARIVYMADGHPCRVHGRMALVFAHHPPHMPSARWDGLLKKWR